MKKLLLLGGSKYLIPVINAAHKLGCYVITCDYLPDNYAHKFADEYINISIVEKEKVLEIAQKKRINGILSFACDPGVITAAYVAEKMQLPYVADYQTVCILQNKDLFRKLLQEHGFNVPKSKSYSNIKAAMFAINEFKLPVIVKPVDSAGSKGVSKVSHFGQWNQAIENAFCFSIKKRIIIEEYIESMGDPTDSDCFSVDGKMVCVTFSNQKFDHNALNPYTPAGFSFPSNMDNKYQKDLILQLQKLCNILNLKTSIYNVEARIGKDGKAYIMEVSPRGGGNRLAEMIRYATDIDLIEASVQSAIGMEIQEITQPTYHGFWYEHILHSNKEGFYEELYIDPSLEKFLVEKDIWIKQHTYVRNFAAANETIGTLIFQFPSNTLLENSIFNITEKIKVIVK